jgi:four helix bundle protein
MEHTHERQGYFAHERLAAYGLALDALRFEAGRKAKLAGLPGGLAAQFERALVGAHTNLCAGAAAHGAEARRHFRIALSEAGEAGGCLDAVHVLGALSASEHTSLRATLLRLCACLYGLAY